MHRLKEVTWCPQHTTKQKHPYIFRRHHLTEHSPYVNFTQIPYQRSEMKIMKRLPHQVSERIFLLIRLAETETPRRKDSRHFRYESLTTHSQRMNVLLRIPGSKAEPPLKVDAIRAYAPQINCSHESIKRPFRSQLRYDTDS